MSMLKNTRIYLCGPVETDPKASNWREDATTSLESIGMTVLDPLKKPSWMPNVTGERQRELKETLSKAGPGLSQVHDLAMENDIARDYCLGLIRAADILLVNLQGNKFTVGTWEEIALSKDKPIFIVHEEIIPSMWLCSMCHIYTSWERETYLHRTMYSAIDKIQTIDREQLIKNNPLKWIFLTYKDQIQKPTPMLHEGQYPNEIKYPTTPKPDIRPPAQKPRHRPYSPQSPDAGTEDDPNSRIIL